MPGRDPLAQFLRLIHEGFAAGNDAVVDEVVAPDFVEHQFGLEGSGPAAIAQLKDAVRGVHRMIPDVQYTVEDVAVVGDTVWVRLLARGTHCVRVMGQEPTGRPLALQVIDVARFRDGLMAEHWGVPDRFALMMQVGAFPPAHRPEPAPASPATG
jgi:predicted ester cyclase